MKTRISSIMDTRKKKAGAIIAVLVLTLAVGTGFVLASTPAQANNPAYLGAPVVVGDDAGAFNWRADIDLDGAAEPADLGFSSRPLTESELAERGRRVDAMPDSEPIPVICMAEMRELAEQGNLPDGVRVFHSDDLDWDNIIIQPMELLGVRRSDEYLYTAEEWAYILERIEAGLTVWLD
jgi:hypothetical protein